MTTGRALNVEHQYTSMKSKSQKVYYSILAICYLEVR